MCKKELVEITPDLAVLNFGANSDVNLTHVTNTGLLLNSSRQLQFRNSDIYIGSNDDNVLDITSDGSIDLHIYQVNTVR